jgi:hypothetical protein
LLALACRVLGRNCLLRRLSSFVLSYCKAACNHVEHGSLLAVLGMCEELPNLA